MFILEVPVHDFICFESEKSHFFVSCSYYSGLHTSYWHRLFIPDATYRERDLDRDHRQYQGGLATFQILGGGAAHLGVTLQF